MPSDDALESELKRLRKGRGVLADDLDGRIGPELAQVCGVMSSDSAVIVRRKVIERLTDLTTRLPEDLRLIAQVSLALHEETRHRFLAERLQWVAERLQRDARTIRRRADEA